MFTVILSCVIKKTFLGHTDSALRKSENSQSTNSSGN